MCIPKVSVIIPVYNTEKYVRQAVESILLQTLKDIEIIIVNDGSTDGSMTILEELAAQDERIKLFSQENQGLSVTRNVGLSHSTGEYVYFMDSDDLLTGDAVAKLYDVMNHIGSEFVGMCFRKATLSGHMIGISGTVWSKSMVMQPIMAGHILKGDLAYFFRTNVMRECPFPEFPGEKFVPELYIWNKIADIGKIVFYVDQVIYLCEYLPDGYTSNFKKNLRSNPCGFGLFYRDQVIRDTRLFGKVKACVRSLQCILYCWLKK